MKNLYIKIRKFLQPWWNPVPDELKELRALKENKDDTPEKPKQGRILGMKRSKPTNYKVKSFENGLPVIRLSQSAVGLVSSGKVPEFDIIWGYHNQDTHEVVVRLKHDPNNPPGYRFTERSSQNRRKLKPLLYPIINDPFDRTHTVPHGISGLEADPFVLVGWDSEQNRHPFNEFEQKAKSLTKTNDLIWICQIKRLPYGAKWTYVILDANTGNRLMHNTWTYGSQQKPIKFWWAH